MSVNTKTTEDRRAVRYESLNDLLADVRQLAEGDARMAGNWTLGQILQHLAIAYAGSIDGLSFRVSWPTRVMARLFMKRKFLDQALPSGFQIPPKNQEELVPVDTTTTEEGLAALESAVSRLQNESHRVDHPVLGKLSLDEWTKFHLRHAEMHLSFAHPA